MKPSIPALLDSSQKGQFPAVVQRESDLLGQARRLFDDGYYDHALLDVWNASVHNLRRRIEAYGIDLFESVAKDESGRKKYDKSGETVSERWAGVDELVLINCATKLGLLNKKAGKSLEMINWMRNHASPAHDSDHKVEQEDVIGLVLILQKNLFEADLPDPGHSVSGLFDPIRKTKLGSEELELLSDQIEALKVADVKVAFGFLLDLLCKGSEPALTNTKALFPVVWDRASEDLKKTAGLRYHAYKLNPDEDDSSDKGGAPRILDFLTNCEGIQYIPDGARASIYRRAAKSLAVAKDSSYGWASEVSAAKTLKQFGPYVPTAAFAEVYQEILAVWCGNYWGDSDASEHLEEFIDTLNTKQLRVLANMFVDNERVRAELFQSKPKAKARKLLKEMKSKFTIQAHLDEIDSIITAVDEL
ncbi:hypothetical protein [Burkholderia cepacia]|uniref:hypothetical protein n=1 Tax=Burkholderia cepacia TaxID=292 RepID=UPI00162AF43E|nr:hypothetical protein [Burkholderia cepacia]